MADSTVEKNDIHERSELVELKAYVDHVLGLKLRLTPWNHVNTLPYALRDRYEFLVTEIFGAKCLILKERLSRDTSVADVAKHMHVIKLQALKKTSEILDSMIFVTDSLPSYDRKRLVEKGVQFIVPGNQLYLPAFGMDLREYYRQRMEKPQLLSPATQSMLIQSLIKGWQRDQPTTRSSFERAFSYAKMTITRALSELTALDIVRLDKEGTESSIVFTLSAREVWEKAKDHMRTPVKKTIWLNALPEALGTPMLLAGETALAELSLLASPRIPCFATTTPQFDDILKRAQSEQYGRSNEAYGEAFSARGSRSGPAKTTLETISLFHEVPQNHAVCCIQLWSYEPFPGNTNAAAVDPFSLYLSLKDGHDDRVQICLDEMMENVKW